VQAKKLTICALAASCLLASSLADARMYRYKDDNGQMVISNTVPQEASTRGYEILNSQGRVVERVDAAPTEEELRQRSEQERKQQEAEAQRDRDKALLRRYRHPNDAVRALHRKIEELEGLIQLKRGNISVIESQLDTEQSRAADLERSGREIPDATLDKIERLQTQIQDIEGEIATQAGEIEQIREDYREDIERLELITDQERTLPLEPEPTKTNQ
jgi:chromosome segregation ATPase